MTFGHQIDPRTGFVASRSSGGQIISTILNVGSGFNLKLFKLDFGLALFNMFAPDEGFSDDSELPRRWSSYLRYNFKFNKDFELNPGLQIQKQRDFQTLMIGTEGAFKVLTFLLAYRNDDALIFGVGIKFKKIHLQYAYDYTTSMLNSNTGGSHEFGLRFGFEK